MITQSEYEHAQEIVWSYEEQLKEELSKVEPKENLTCPFCGGEGERKGMDKHCPYCNQYW